MKEYVVSVDVRVYDANPGWVINLIEDELQDGEAINDIETHLVQEVECLYHHVFDFSVTCEEHPVQWIADAINYHLQENEEVEVNIRFSEQTL